MTVPVPPEIGRLTIGKLRCNLKLNNLLSDDIIESSSKSPYDPVTSEEEIITTVSPTPAETDIKDFDPPGISQFVLFIYKKCNILLSCLLHNDRKCIAYCLMSHQRNLDL